MIAGGSLYNRQLSIVIVRHRLKSTLSNYIFSEANGMIGPRFHLSHLGLRD